MIEVLYQDDDVIVINKPAGMAVHPSPGWGGPTVVQALAEQGVLLSSAGASEREGVVHRLDANTTGVMVLAKSERAFKDLKDQFRDRETAKVYHALVQGHITPSTGTVDAPIDRHPKHGERFAVVSTGRDSLTHYQTLEAFRGASLIEVDLETGRTHQIRVHMEHLKHPLFNDDRYGGDQILKGTTFSKYKQFVKNCFEICPRHALHARSLGFVHPTTKKEMYFESELPSDMAQLLDRWRTYIASRELELEED